MGKDRRYEPGTVGLVGKQYRAGDDPDDSDYFDTIDGDGQDGQIVRVGPYATLGHQCDGWMIGGKRQVEQPIADLQKLLPLLADDKERWSK